MEFKELGSRIKKARLAKKFTQEQLAERADIGFYYLGEIERGVKVPSLKVFVQLVEALGVSADSLLRDELSSGKECANNEITSILNKLTPKQREGSVSILEAYIKSL